MPKGFPSSRPKSILEKNASLVVPPGATHYPGSECAEHPVGILIPPGIRIRNGKSVEVRFQYHGTRVSEPLRGTPTVAFVQEVARKLERVQQLITLGKFGDDEYAEEFPSSRKLTRKPVVIESVRTVGIALDEWMQSRRNTVGQNSENDYDREIRNQLKIFKFCTAVVAASDYIPFPKDHVVDQRLFLKQHEGGPARPVNPHDHCIFGQLPISLVTDVMINTMRNQLLKEGLKGKRIDNLMIPLRGAMTREAMLKNLTINPFSTIKPLIQTSHQREKMGKDDTTDLDAPLPDGDLVGFLKDEKAPDPFTTDEIEKIICNLDAPMGNQMTFAFWTGLRTGEIIGLRASDLQLDKNRILVRRSVSRGVLKTTKTNKQRWVHLLPPAKAALEAQLALFGAPGGWVFPNPFTKQRWKNESKITRRWKRALAAAGIRYRRPYQTRHTFASMHLSSGENVMYVAQQMGHADWSMLIKVYGHWIPSGGLQAAGSLVAAAQTEKWQRLRSILDARAGDVDTDYLEDDADDELDDEQDETAIQSFIAALSKQTENADTAGTNVGQNCRIRR